MATIIHRKELCVGDSATALLDLGPSYVGGTGAEVAAPNGASVVLIGRRGDRLKSLRAQIENRGGRALDIQADVTVPIQMFVRSK